MSAIKRCANDFILRNHIHSLQLDLSTLRHLCDRLGYHVLSFQEGMELIMRYDLTQYTALDGFTYIYGDIKIIFYRDNLAYGEKTFVICHEIGHIFLDHTYHGVLGISEQKDICTSQEDEANEFAYHILATPCVLKRCGANSIHKIKDLTLLDGNRAEYVLKNLENDREIDTDRKVVVQFHKFILSYAPKKDLFSAVLFLVLLGVILFLVLETISTHRELEYTQSQNFQSQSQTTVQLIENEKVYVTANGSKYHLPGCYHIKDRNITQMTVAEAIENGYGACKTCDPPAV